LSKQFDVTHDRLIAAGCGAVYRSECNLGKHCTLRTAGAKTKAQKVTVCGNLRRGRELWPKKFL
jgi:hypothetical protein